MLRATELIGGGSGIAAAAPTIEYTDADSSDDTASSYTFSSAAIGAEAANRKVVIAITAAGSTNGVLSGVTVGGSSATERINFRYYSTISAFYDIELATGTAEDIVVSLSGNKSHSSIGVWAAYGFATGTPSDTSTGAIATDTVDITMTIPAKGGAIAAANIAGGSISVSWTGLTEDFETHYGGEPQTHSGAHDVFDTLQTELSITAVISGPNNFGVGVAYAAA